MEITYEIPMEMENVEDFYDILRNTDTVEAEVNLPKQTGYMKKRTVIIIFLILDVVIISVGVCIGVYFAGKTTAEGKINLILTT